MNKHPKKLLLVLALVVLCLSSAYYAHTYTKAKANSAKYFSDLGVVEEAGNAMASYADHHKGYLPNSRNWEESISLYWQDKNNTVALKEHPGNRLAMNSELSGVNIHHLDFASGDGPILLYETHSNIKNASGIPPWNQCYQCGEASKGRLMIAFTNGWAYSYAEGPEMGFTKK